MFKIINTNKSIEKCSDKVEAPSVVDSGFGGIDGRLVSTDVDD